jgi:hypothetical protein
MDANLRMQMFETYLKQQQQLTNPSPVNSAPPSVAGDALVLYNKEVPEDITLEEFKNYVKKWLEYDNFIKKAQEVIKEKKKIRDKLSVIITKFMCKYNIEDLNTKEGRIRCKTLVVKTPVSQKVIKEKIINYFSNDENRRNDILNKIYEEDRGKIEKVSLRRLKIS